MNDNKLIQRIKDYLRIEKSHIILYFVIIILIALAFRYYKIELKPPHHDEGVNGWFIMQMWQNGYYNYDPQNYHGPIYFYLLQATETIFGKGILGMRFITALISMGTVMLILLHYRFAGRAALWAALATAISPAMVFYARYAIHESLLIFFQALFSLGFFMHYYRYNRKAGLICMIIGFFGGWGTKETFFIFYVCWGIAVVVLELFSKDFPTKQLAGEPELPTGKIKFELNFTMFWSLTVFIILIVIFTGFLMDMQGFKDMFSTFMKWTSTGTAKSGHDKVWHYWIAKLMPDYEWIALGSVGLAVILFLFGPKFGRMWAMLGVGFLLAYSIIPYKTPWIIMNFIWPLFFVFGYFIEWLISLMPKREYGIIVMVAALILVGRDTVRMYDIVFKRNAHPDEGYVYTHTDVTMNYFMEHMWDAVDKHPDLKNMDVKIYIKQTWPLPWVFGDWPHTAYGTLPSTSRLTGDIFLIDKIDENVFEAKIQEPFVKVQGKLRGAYTDILFYYKNSVFQDSWKDNPHEKKTLVYPDQD